MSSTRVFPGVQFDSESSKKNHSEISSPHIHQEIDVDFSSSRVFPSVPFDSESSKENPIKTSAATETNTSYNDEKDIHATKTNPEVAFDNMSTKDEEEVDTVEDKTIIQDAFIFCPTGGTLALNKVLKQGIFASKQEMNQLEETKNSIFN